jgi:hypothetical protein
MIMENMRIKNALMPTIKSAHFTNRGQLINFAGIMNFVGLNLSNCGKSWITHLRL